jgi:glycosyltransferase involved in cell wall biosynthesis
MTHDLALVHFKRAREHYVTRRFELAQQEIKKYKQSIDYRKFDQSDRRTVSALQISVVVVTHQEGPNLLSCLQSVLAQAGPSFEVILVDNGGHEQVRSELAELPLLTVKAPMNLLPSEGRNIGAHFARGDLIVFLDDDAVMAQGYLESAYAAMKDDSRMGLRGQAVSKTPHKTAPPHYSLGQRPKQAEFNMEGNMLIRKTVLEAVGGFDALMFGHEGKELTQRCMRQFPGMVIQYRPELCIAHDFAEMDLLDAKRARQSLGQDYLKFLQSKHMNPGISILVRAGDDLAAAHDFLDSLVKLNSYRPIEVLLWANNTQQALATSGKFITQIFVRVLPEVTPSLGRVGQQARYDNLLIVDLPFKVTGDVLHQWTQQDKTSNPRATLYRKQDFVKLLLPILNNPNRESSIIPITLPRRREIKKINENKNVISNSRFDPGLRFVAGMATIPERLPTLTKVIDSIVSQFDEIHVYLNGHNEKPNFQKWNNVIFHLDDTYGDLGAKGKFLGLKFTEQNDYYFSLDDDFIYPPDYSENIFNTLSKYKNEVGVCVHGSIFGHPLDWYFERISVFSSRQGLESDRFINLPGTGTFAFKISTFPIAFSDFMPRTMCDLTVAMKARRLNIPIVSIGRPKNWIKSIESDSTFASENDYWSKMLKDDEGRTDIAKKIDWSFQASKEYIFDALTRAEISLHNTFELKSKGFDLQFIDGLLNNYTPETWNPEYSENYYVRKYQYFSNLRKGSISSLTRDEILLKPIYKNLESIKAMALQAKIKWETYKNE